VNKVCPDHQLLSVYYDGELPSPWREKMESHIAGCSACAGRLEAYRRVSLGKTADGEGDAGLEAARERVWKKLEAVVDSPAIGRPVEDRPRTAADASPAGPQKRARAVRAGAAGLPVWRRSVSIPLPAAAAAAAVFVLLVALAFLLVLRVPSTEGISGMAFASETDFEAPGIIPASNMEDVLQYLGGRDNGDIIILRLPESRSFVNYSEPAIIKAADYSRTVPGRRRQ